MLFLQRKVFACDEAQLNSMSKDAVVALYLKQCEQSAILEEKIRQLKLSQEQLSLLVETDTLTGLGNRFRLERSLNEKISLVLRIDSFPLTLIMLDIDFFKTVNDTYGHSAGDKVLQTVGRLLLENSRGSDVPCRHGGEEFSVVMENTRARDGRIYAERIRRKFEKETVLFGDKRIKFTASFGVVTIDKPTCLSREVLMNVTDAMLYEAKKTGRNRVCSKDYTGQEVILHFPVPLISPERVLVAAGQQ